MKMSSSADNPRHTGKRLWGFECGGAAHDEKEGLSTAIKTSAAVRHPASHGASGGSCHCECRLSESRWETPAHRGWGLLSWHGRFGQADVNLNVRRGAAQRRWRPGWARVLTGPGMMR